MPQILFVLATIGLLTGACMDEKVDRRNDTPPFFASNVNLQDFEVDEVWKELREKYGVERGDDFIITYDGKKYQKNRWDDIEAGLMFQQHHPEKTKNVYASYKSRLGQYLAQNAELKKKFDDWLWNHIYFLGSELVDPIAMIKGNAYLSNAMNDEFEGHLGGFFGELIAFEQPYPVQIKKDGSTEKLKIMIIGTSGFGGGHDSAARALANYLESQHSADIEVSYVDTKKLHPEKDVMFRVTGAIHSESIYDDIYQKENKPRKAVAYWQVLSELKYFIPDISMQLLEDEVREKKPDMIFSVIHNRPELVNLAYSFGVPMRIVSTDYELQHMLLPYVERLEANLVRILTTTEQAKFFEKLAVAASSWRGFFRAATKDAAQKYVFERVTPWSEFVRDIPVFDILGYPVHDSFLQDFSKIDKAATRAKYGIVNESSKVIPLTMGKQGAGTIKQSLNSLLTHEEDLNFDLDIFILTGNNRMLRKELEEQYKVFSSGKINLHIMGLLTGDQLAELYNITDILLSKPGGATVAEVSVMQVALLAPEYYPWERGNIEYLKQLGLGYEHKDYNTLALKLNELLAQGKRSKKNLWFPNWKSNLERIIHDGLWLRSQMHTVSL